MSSPEVKRLHIVPGISGTGKTTVCRALEASLCADGISTRTVVPHTTRPPRPGEVNGRDYHFHHSLPPLDEGWRVSEIGQYFYFNSDQHTLPDEMTPVKLLPVAYSALAAVVSDYSRPDVRMTVIPIVIGNDIQDRWLSDIVPQRPGRDVCRELAEQDEMLESIYPWVDEIFYPSWICREDDVNRYVLTARSLLFATREAILTRR